ncbi:MAG: hypothetical protein BAJALOKI3v1_50123 [Promethearchaeota archaeon]|nr:MAG: hypothetical protein BAJALOKI3v1_50123 [Candidatus Lokiarchaeota archaeon]
MAKINMDKKEVTISFDKDKRVGKMPRTIISGIKRKETFVGKVNNKKAFEFKRDQPAVDEDGNVADRDALIFTPSPGFHCKSCRIGWDSITNEPFVEAELEEKDG